MKWKLLLGFRVRGPVFHSCLRLAKEQTYRDIIEKLSESSFGPSASYELQVKSQDTASQALPATSILPTVQGLCLQTNWGSSSTALQVLGVKGRVPAFRLKLWVLGGFLQSPRSYFEGVPLRLKRGYENCLLDFCGRLKLNIETF